MIKHKKRAKINFRKRLIYNFMLLCITFLFLFILEIILRIAGYGDDLGLFINNPDKDFKEYKIVNPYIGKKYFQKLEYTSPANDIFLKEKPDNAFRVFVMGSSTAIGFPYNYNLMFSRILQERLKDSYPDKYIEVVNTAITAINSYTLLDYMDDILKEEPDAIIIYAGHNEFYGAFGAGSNEAMSKYRKLTFLHLDLMSLRIYQLLQNAITGAGRLFAGHNKDSEMRGTLMKRIAGNKKIAYKSETYNIGIERYKENMSDILEKAHKKNVPVFISALVCNVRDCKPFCSTHTHDYPEALNIYDKAAKYEAEEDYASAKENYYLAKDLDCIRFRATEEINDIIRELAAEYEAVLVPMKTLFEDESENGLIGNNLLTEHVHPNIDGYFLMADEFFNEIARSGLIGSNINILHYHSPQYYKINWGYTALDSLLAVHRINNLKYHWPFKPLDAPFIDYRLIYKPVSMIDSLAFTVMKSPDLNIVDAHLELARFYKKRNDFYKAFREYNAAITCSPFWAEDYLDAAECLIKINDFTTALEYLDKSIELKETFFAYFTKGDILLLKRDYKNASDAFEKASGLVSNKENEAKLMSKQILAYYYSGQVEKSREVLNEIRKINPNYSTDFRLPEANYILLFPAQVKRLIISALNSYNNGDLDTALNELLRSLEIKETPVANRITGEILLKRNHKDAIYYLLKAAPDFKNDPGFLYNLAVCYLRNGKPEEAQKIMARIKSINPGFQELNQLEKLLKGTDH
jgi:tetratricopeptide (TPR) repeat protein